jgi:hypothetical protein
MKNVLIIGLIFLSLFILGCTIPPEPLEKGKLVLSITDKQIEG